MPDYCEQLRRTQEYLQAEKVRWNARLQWDASKPAEKHAQAQEGMRQGDAFYRQFTDALHSEENRQWLAGRISMRHDETRRPRAFVMRP